jgi:hypothetical protein
MDSFPDDVIYVAKPVLQGQYPCPIHLIVISGEKWTIQVQELRKEGAGILENEE